MKRVLLILLLVVCFSCKDSKITKENSVIDKVPKKPMYNDIGQLNGLVGNWNRIETEDQTQENWTQLNDSTLVLNGYTLVENDTVFHERAILQQQGEETYFTVTNMLKQEEPSVPFRMSSCENGMAVFENSDNEFPQKIIYHQPLSDTLYARIEGTINDEFHEVDFYFTKE